MALAVAMKSIRIFTLVLLLSPIAGCGESGNTPAPVGEITAQGLNEATKFVPASREESDALVRSVEAAVANQDARAFSAILDQEKMVDRILVGLGVNAKFRAGFMKGMIEGGGLTNLSNEIIGAVQKGGDYKFVRMTENGGEFRPLFRLTLPDSGGINYHELVVSTDAAKRPRIADMYVYLSGELLTQTIRRLVLPAVAAENAGIMARLTGTESDFLKHISTMQQINSLQKSGQFQQAMGLFATLPDSLQRDKTILLTKLLVAQQLNDQEYAKVIKDLDQYFPNDAARDFRAMDLLVLQEQHEELIQTIDRLLAVLQDPYLNILKVDSLLALDRTEDAQKAVAAAKAVAPDKIDIYWVEISLTLRTKDHAQTAALLDEIGEKFGMTFNDLTAIPEYADFAASDLGKAWMARNPAE